MSLLAYSLITIIARLSWLLYILIMIRVILSWVPMNNNFTELIDFSPLLFIITIEAVEKILIRLIIVIF